MTALNKKGSAPKIKNPIPNAVSYNGNPQWAKASAHQLYELVVMSLYGKDAYYESTDAKLARLTSLVNDVVSDGNLDFVANAAIHARYAMNIRSFPVILVVLFAKALRDQKKQYANLRRLTADVIGRADQITDLYAFALATFGNKKAIPTAIKRGVADAFNNFSEYHFAKYNRSAAVKFRDVLRIVHPKGKNEQQGAIFKKIMEDTLTVPYTWEVELSTNGQKPEGERKSATTLWTELATSGKMGYMAVLRNLRNILDAKVDGETINHIAKFLSDPTEVAKSKQLPFRFLNALQAIEGHSSTKLRSAISKAVDHSLGNLPKLGENVWIIIDCSGSMSGQPIQTACFFASALAKAHADSTNVKVTMFSDSSFHVAVDTESSVISNTERLMQRVVGGGTNLQSALDRKDELGFEPDTVIILSDMQVDMLSSRDPSRLFTNAVRVAINLNSYGSTPLDEVKGWYQLSGWSDRLFDFVPALRNKKTVVETLSVPYIGRKDIRKVGVVEDEGADV